MTGSASTSSRRLFVALVAASLLATRVASLKLSINSGAEECFTTTLTEERKAAAEAVGEKLTLNGGFLVTNRAPTVDATVTSPGARMMWNRRRVNTEQKFEIPLGPELEVGEYRLCLRSLHRAVSVDVPYFLVSHSVQDAGEAIYSPLGATDFRGEEAAQHVHLQEVHKGVERVKELLVSLSGEAKYMKRRLKRHAVTTASTNSRTISYTFLEVGVLLVVAALQIFIYRRMFIGAEAKRGWH